MKQISAQLVFRGVYMSETLQLCFTGKVNDRLPDEKVTVHGGKCGRFQSLNSDVGRFCCTSVEQTVK